MQNKIDQISHELQLLGWSEEGSKNYAENFLEESNINLFYIDINYIIYIILIILILYIFIIYSYKKNKSFFIPKNLDNQKSEKKYCTELDTSIVDLNANDDLCNDIPNSVINIKGNNNKQFKNLIVLFKDTSIDIDNLIEHILFICFTLIEFFVKFITLIYIQDKKLLKNIDHLQKASSSEYVHSSSFDMKEILIEERKHELLSKKNLELKKILRNVTKTTKLNKKELVDKVLELEFGRTL